MRRLNNGIHLFVKWDTGDEDKGACGSCLEAVLVTIKVKSDVLFQYDYRGDKRGDLLLYLVSHLVSVNSITHSSTNRMDKGMKEKSESKLCFFHTVSSAF